MIIKYIRDAAIIDVFLSFVMIIIYLDVYAFLWAKRFAKHILTFYILHSNTMTAGLVSDGAARKGFPYLRKGAHERSYDYCNFIDYRCLVFL